MDAGTITVVATMAGLTIALVAVVITLHSLTTTAISDGIDSVRADLRGLRTSIDALTARVDRLYDRRTGELEASPGTRD